MGAVQERGDAAAPEDGDVLSRGMHSRDCGAHLPDDAVDAGEDFRSAGRDGSGAEDVGIRSKVRWPEAGHEGGKGRGAVPARGCEEGARIHCGGKGSGGEGKAA